jgi:hypothetical protein
MTTTKTITNFIQRKETVTYCLFAAIVVLVGLYIYFLSASVVHVVMRKETTRLITEVSSHIATLEGRYIEAQHRVSDAVATLDGYQKPTEKIFVERGEPSLVLRDNVDNER